MLSKVQNMNCVRLVVYIIFESENYSWTSLVVKFPKYISKNGNIIMHVSTSTDMHNHIMICTYGRACPVDYLQVHNAPGCVCDSVSSDLDFWFRSWKEKCKQQEIASLIQNVTKRKIGNKHKHYSYKQIARYEQKNNNPNNSGHDEQLTHETRKSERWSNQLQA